MQITFLGATKTVTGSKYLISFEDNKNIMIDCGLFQGYNASDERNTILFTGYQAGGTRGARMLNGEKEIKIHGQMIPVRANIEVIHNVSAHADYAEILAWLKHFKSPPKKTFVTHGELEAALSLKNKIEAELGWNCVVPHYKETELLI